MPTTASPAEILKLNRDRANRMAQEAGQARTRRLLEKAQRELSERIASAVPGPDGETFSLTQMRVTLVQIKDTLQGLRKGMRGSIIEHGKATAEESAKATVDYLDSAERMYRGINQPLDLDRARVMDRAVAGAESSILHRIESDPEHEGHLGVLDRYDSNVIQRFEEELQLRYVTKTPWADVRAKLVDASPFLQDAPASWAERIMRTETMNAGQTASLGAIVEADKDLNDMTKIMCATFDDRTAADSYAVHGQIRRPVEMFDTWQGAVMNPPARPNDREVVVPHRIAWPIPPALEPKSDGEVFARWAMMGRKGSPPARPRMETVDRALFGVQQPPPVASS